MLIVSNPAALQAAAGAELGHSAWVTIDQPVIDRFAELTGDSQWIHVDVDRARRETPNGKTIAHGYLTLSLLPRLVNSLLEVRAVNGLNYGADRLRFLSPVPSGASVRLSASLSDVAAQGGGWRVRLASTVEIQGSDRPALVADLTFLFFFGEDAA